MSERADLSGRIFQDELNIGFCLNSLRGHVCYTDFIAFDQQQLRPTPVTLVEKAEQLTIVDPRSNPSALLELSRIHQLIERTAVSIGEGQEEQLQFRYWLATLFHSYMQRYDLFQEGFGCRRAWAHLLRIRYESMVGLYRLREKTRSKLTQGEERELLRAFRDWRDFCTNEEHHFLFKQSQDQDWGSPEDEVRRMIYGKGNESDPPISFFLQSKTGSRLLDYLIADWFLRDRYDLGGAVRLVWQRARAWFYDKGWRKSLRIWFTNREWREALGYVGLNITMMLVTILTLRWIEGSSSWVQVLLWIVYGVVLVLIGWGIKWRLVMDVLLPRVGAASVVGYLPLVMTGDMWKLACNREWWGGRGWGMLLINILAGGLAFVYLRWWEIGNQLRRTPDLKNRVPVLRAVWLMLWSWLAAFFIGLVILDTVGTPLARVIWDDKPAPPGTPGVVGMVHLPVLFLFTPLALLIGVIVQIFWEEKSITHPA
jgi:hypothetical protein